ncbi:hypothetical protein N9M66_00315 [Litoreibacter sp.]|nr:hypothetical protein [Litoreibacter sp.]
MLKFYPDQGSTRLDDATTNLGSSESKATFQRMSPYSNRIYGETFISNGLFV